MIKFSNTYIDHAEKKKIYRELTEVITENNFLSSYAPKLHSKMLEQNYPGHIQKII